MSSEIVFLAPYPTNENIKDGMISRVKAIDGHFSKIERTYLHVSAVRHRKKEQYRDGIVSVYNLNIVLHFWTILKIMRAHTNVYSHSIYMLRFLWVLLNKSQNVILDLHGVVPEEERDFKQNSGWKYYSYLEKQIFKKLSTAVCVTHRMKNHYKEKYPWYKGDFLVYSIMPDFLEAVSKGDFEDIKVHSKDKVHVLYSGGSQLWQNIDLMLNTIKENQSPRIHYTILTGDKEVFEAKIKEKNISPENITIESRHPSDLWKDYIAADYAFILRDDNLVNNVANPTKLVEYLFYGLIPVVLSPSIGDYNELGYQYLALNSFNKDVVKPFEINTNNIDIAKRLITENSQLDIKQILMPA